MRLGQFQPPFTQLQSSGIRWTLSQRTRSLEIHISGATGLLQPILPALAGLSSSAETIAIGRGEMSDTRQTGAIMIDTTTALAEWTVTGLNHQSDPLVSPLPPPPAQLPLVLLRAPNRPPRPPIGGPRPPPPPAPSMLILQKTQDFPQHQGIFIHPYPSDYFTNSRNRSRKKVGGRHSNHHKYMPFGNENS